MDKKGAGISTETTGKILLLLGFLVVAVLIIGAFTGLFSGEGSERTVCYVSNGLISSNFFFKAVFPTACSTKIVIEPVDQAKLSGLLTDAWWMFGKGSFDLGNVGHETFTPFVFNVKEDIPVAELYNYLVTHKGETLVSDRSKSDYDYLQKGSPGQTICFAKDMIVENEQLKLSKDELYYINFFDDQKPHKCGDKILISKTAGFSKSFDLDSPNFFFCYSPDTNNALIVVTTFSTDPALGLISPLLTGIGLYSGIAGEGNTICNLEEPGTR